MPKNASQTSNGNNLSADSLTKTPARSVAVISNSLSPEETERIDRSLKDAAKSHYFLKSDAAPTELLAELQEMDVDLVLLASPKWKASAKSVYDLIYGYESGARVTVARRPSEAMPPWQILTTQIAWLYIFFGARRKDPDSPLRLYDKEAFMHILQVLSFYENKFPAHFQLSAIEHYFDFRTIGIEVDSWMKNGASPTNSSSKTKSNMPAPTLDFLSLIKESQKLKSAIRAYRAENQKKNNDAENIEKNTTPAKI